MNSFADCSFIGGGCCNEICSAFSAVVGGCNNKVTSGYTGNSIVGGECNTIGNTGGRSFIGGGQCNQINSCYSSYHAILGGFRNIISNEYGYGNNSIVGGCANLISDYNASCNFIGSGNNNTISGYSAARHSIVGGSTNTINGYTSRSSILGGCGNTVNHSCAFIIGANITTTAACTTFMNNASVGATLKLPLFTSTSVTTNGSLNPVQVPYASTQDTLALLAVDPSGNVVKGSQEGTWTFTKAQLDALSTTTGTTLLTNPGSGKAVIIEESNWMVKYSGTGTFVSDNSYVVIQSSNITNAEVTRLPSGQINNIMSSAPANPSYGFYSRDLPLYNLDGRTYKTNESTKFRRVNTTSTPTNLISISIKLKYRVFDVDTF